jgi:hypothetical protein
VAIALLHLGIVGDSAMQRDDFSLRGDGKQGEPLGFLLDGTS